MYTFGIPGWLIYSLHLLVGLFLISTGNNLRMNRPIPTLSKQILTGLGVISALYQAFLWYRGGRAFYNYNVPGWLIHLIHIFNGLMFISLGTDLVPARFRLSPNNASLYLIILGALAATYHLHLWVFA